jgi:lysophospholipase L1-like esterase
MQPKVICFGHSLVRQLGVALRRMDQADCLPFPDLDAVRIEGKPGTRACDPAEWKRLEEVLKPNRRKGGSTEGHIVAIMSGTNDIERDNCASEIYDGIMRMVEICGARRVVVNTLAPNGEDVCPKMMAKRKQLNDLLRANSALELLKLDESKPELSDDGIHFSHAGYCTLANEIAGTI